MAILSRQLRRRPARLLEDAQDALRRPMRVVSRRPYASTGGILLLLLGVVGLATFYPEMHRYLRVRQM
jgi:hypothetical protein